MGVQPYQAVNLRQSRWAEMMTSAAEKCSNSRNASRADMHAERIGERSNQEVGAWPWSGLAPSTKLNFEAARRNVFAAERSRVEFRVRPYDHRASSCWQPRPSSRSSSSAGRPRRQTPCTFRGCSSGRVDHVGPSECDKLQVPLRLISAVAIDSVRGLTQQRQCDAVLELWFSWRQTSMSGFYSSEPAGVYSWA